MKKMKNSLRSGKAKTYDDLVAQRAGAILRAKGAWWWKFLIPVKLNAQHEPGLQCAVCDAMLSAGSPSKIAGEHLLKIHKINSENGAKVRLHDSVSVHPGLVALAS